MYPRYLVKNRIQSHFFAFPVFPANLVFNQCGLQLITNSLKTMNQADILAYAVTVEERSLGELQHWLNYAKHTWSLGAGIIWLPYGLILMALKIVAFIFTPYMLWHLFKAKWYKSVVVLLAVVVVPFIASQFIQTTSVIGFLFMVLPFLTFYLFTYIISYMIGEQLIKIKTLKKWEREQMMKEQY